MKKKALLKLLLVALFIASVMLLVSCSKNFVVSFDADGGTAVNSIEVKSGQKIGAAPVTEKAGYTFDGWYLNDDKWNFESWDVTRDITLKARWIKNHSVTFDANGGSDTSASNTVVLDGSKITAPENPIKEGAEFIGWFAGDVQWNFAENTVTADTTLTAMWREIFIVKFDSDGGNIIASQSVKNGDLATKPMDPSRFGHEFAGWYNGDTPWDFATPITAGITLKAKWTPIYTVTFSTDGAGKLDPVRLLNGSLIPVPAEVQKPGYIFAGWYYENALWDFATMTVTKDVKLEARWTPITYGVIIDKDNGEAPTEVALMPNNKIPAPEAPTRQGYEFAGWYVFDAASNTLSSTPWNFNEDVVTAPVIIKAKWIKTWTVSFEAFGTIYDSYTVYDGSLVEAPLFDPEIPGAVFNGWLLDTTPWDFATGTVHSNITLTASFLTKHTVRFDSAGAGNYDDITLIYGEKIPRPADPTKENFIFDGWYNGANLWNFETDFVTGDLTLIAKWATPIKVLFVDSITGNVISSANVLTGHTVSEPKIPTKYGYTFDYWYTTDGEWDFANDTVTEDIVIYAQWNTNYWIISFDTDGAGEINPIFLEKGDTVASYLARFNKSFPEPEKFSFGFGGWLYNGTDTKFTESDAITSDIALKAKWSDTYFVVKFYNNKDDEPVKVQNVAHDHPYVQEPTDLVLDAPTDGTYGFFGWVDINKKAWNFETDVATSDMELYANWLKANTVTLKVDGDVYKTLTAYTGKPAEMKDYTPPKKSGYAFVGWYDASGNLWDLGTKLVSADVTLTARWAKTYTVYYNTEGGSPYYVPSETVNEGGKFTKPQDPTMQKFVFLGWHCDQTNAYWDFNTPVEMDIDLHAIWAPIYYVDFDLAGGAGSFPRQEIVSNPDGDVFATEPIVDPTKNYMIFEAWYLGNAPFDFATPIEGDITLTAKWTNKKYNVTFDANGGTGGFNALYNAGEKLPVPAVSNPGYFLKEWQLPDGSVWDFNTVLTGELTLKAIWTNERVTISFDLADGSSNGSASIAPVTLDYGALIPKFDDPIKTDYFFKGWFRPDGTRWNFETDVATESMTLTAVWDENCTVTFMTENGVYETQTTEKGELVTPPLIAPTKYGYKFLGWYLDENTKWEFTTMPVNYDIVLIAKWELQEYKVTFVTLTPENGEIKVLGEQTIIYGGLITLPDTPDIGENYKFDSWRNAENGDIWNFNTDIVTEDITLKAYWVTPGAGSGGGSIGPWDENENVQGPSHNFS